MDSRWKIAIRVRRERFKRLFIQKKQREREEGIIFRKIFKKYVVCQTSKTIWNWNWTFTYEKRRGRSFTFFKYNDRILQPSMIDLFGRYCSFAVACKAWIPSISTNAHRWRLVAIRCRLLSTAVCYSHIVWKYNSYFAIKVHIIS